MSLLIALGAVKSVSLSYFADVWNDITARLHGYLSIVVIILDGHSADGTSASISSAVALSKS